MSNIQSDIHCISTEDIQLQDFDTILSKKIELCADAIQKINACRAYLDIKIKEEDTTYYGINTGFGSLCHVKISSKDIEKLQANLVYSHACGLGNEVPTDIVRIMLLLKIKNFSYGHSGIRLAVVARLMDMYNQQVTPVVYQLGSLGASGDLAPLAHLSLPLLGEGEVYINNEKSSAKNSLEKLGWPPISLQSKEGLALLNGTQFMSSYAIWCLLKIKKLLQWADIISAISLDAFDCTLEPFSMLVHHVRPHEGQLATAKNILSILQNSEIAKTKKSQVQDPYSFRCVPQVHGASKDAIAQVERVVLREINSVTDNPLVFPEEDKIISGGNFHGQPLALHLDFAAIAVAELGSISERRTYLLISGDRGLPPFLAEQAGIDSGFMITQYTAASIVSKNKQLCTPASVDSIVSSNGQEDHVSMGANAATKLYEVVQNTEMILAIELMNACQAIAFRKPLHTSPFLEKIISAYRQKVSFLHADRLLHTDMIESIAFMQHYKLPTDVE
jgi:histidine ammonia-lyase